MDQSSLGLPASPTLPTAIAGPGHPPGPPQCAPGYELLIELLVCVMHSELSQESDHERQD
jgi:hypothetical protein